MDRFVFFAIPSYTQHCSVEFAQSLADTAAVLAKKDIPHAIMFLNGMCFIDQARNICIEKFMTGIPDTPKATDLFFLDDDVGFRGKDALALIERPESIVFGCYPKKIDEVQFPVVLKLDENDKIIEKDGLVLADSCPAGFLRIKRHVIEELAPRAEKYPYVDGQNNTSMLPNIFETGVKNGFFWGEDVSFAAKAQEAGFDLWCKADIPLSHRGTKLWKNTLEASLSQHRSK